MFGIDDGEDPGPPERLTWGIVGAWVCVLVLAVALLYWGSV